MKIKQIGIGTGAGEEVEVLSRQKIEQIIENLDKNEAMLMAYDSHDYGWKNGYCAVNLETGKIFSFSMRSNESNQACDNNYVVIYKVSQLTETFLSPRHGENLLYLIEDLTEILGACENSEDMEEEEIVDWFIDNFKESAEEIIADFESSSRSNIELEMEDWEEELDIRYTV